MAVQRQDGRRKWPQADFAVYPALVAALWLVCGILLGLGPRSGLPFARSLAAVASVGLLAVLRPAVYRWFLLFLPAGAALAVLHAAAPWRTYPELLPRPICRVWLRGHAANPAAAGEGGFQVLCRLTELRTWADGEWRPCRGAVLLRLPYGAEVPPYGAEIEAAGTLQPIPAAPAGALFDYARHQWKQGVADQVGAESMAAAPPRGWRAAVASVYALRARLAGALGRGMADATARSVVQAMALGYRQRLPAETQADFLASGTIHVFAISGLHVGIVALLGSWLLATFGVPLRIRCLLLVPLVGGYVFMCGGAASAVRAWLMLACWWAARMLRRAPVPVNAVAAAAVLALLHRPLALLETGFLFSFLVVLVLILGWPLVAEFVATLGERVWWLPPSRRRHRWERWRLRPARGLAGAGLAWFGSAGMMAQANGLFVPAGLAVNVGVMGLGTLLLGFAAAKIVLAPLGWDWGERGLAWVLETLARGLCALAGMGGGTGASWRICPLPPLATLLYYGLVFAALRREQKHRSLILAGALLLLLLPTLASRLRPPADWVLAGADTMPPALLVGRGPGGGPVVVNPGTAESAQRIAARLDQDGQARLEGLVLTTGGRQAVGGAAWLLRRYPARVLVVPANHARSASLRQVVALQRARGGRVRLLADEPPAARFGPLRLELAGRAGEQQVRTPLVAGPERREGPGYTLTLAGETRIQIPTAGGWKTVAVPCRTLPFDLLVPSGSD